MVDFVGEVGGLVGDGVFGFTDTFGFFSGEDVTVVVGLVTGAVTGRLGLTVSVVVVFLVLLRSVEVGVGVTLTTGFEVFNFGLVVTGFDLFPLPKFEVPDEPVPERDLDEELLPAPVPVPTICILGSENDERIEETDRACCNDDVELCLRIGMLDLLLVFVVVGCFDLIVVVVLAFLVIDAVFISLAFSSITNGGGGEEEFDTVSTFSASFVNTSFNVLLTTLTLTFCGG